MHLSVCKTLRVNILVTWKICDMPLTQRPRVRAYALAKTKIQMLN